jgi:hypothetical protein
MADNDDLQVTGGLQVIGAPINLGSFLGKGAIPMTQSNMVAAGVPPWMAAGVPTGVSVPSEELDFLPFDEVLNSGVIDPTHTSLEFEAFPQRPFRGERIIISAVSDLGVDSLFALVITPAIFVGATQVGATQGRMPAAAFAAQAFGVRLSFPRAAQGTRIFIPILSLITPGTGHSISVSVGVMGRAVR